MKKLNNLSQLANNSIVYIGVLEKYQLEGSDKNGIKYQHYKLTEYQNALYKRALLGLKMYTKEDKKKMHWEKKKRIARVSKKAQISINLFKQERVNELCKVIQKKLFHNNILVGCTLSSDYIGTDPEFINTLDLRSLGITRKHVIGKFIKEGILPNNFYHLKEIT
tara:strand:+ start:5022 stop:5516 length:495 start_codon:yes stop_codon:yes gene_type:complete